MTDYHQLRDPPPSSSFDQPPYHPHSLTPQQPPHLQRPHLQPPRFTSQITTIQSKNCCTLYWLATSLLILLTCSILIIFSSVWFAQVTLGKDPYPGEWNYDICRVPSIEDNPDYHVEFFAPCKRGFECNICKMPQTEIIFTQSGEEKKLILDLIGHDLKQEDCLQINLDRRFNCVFRYEKTDEGNETNKTQNKNSTKIGKDRNLTKKSSLIPSKLNKIIDGDYTLTVVPYIEYKLNRRGFTKQLKQCLFMFCVGIFLLSLYVLAGLYRCCVQSLQRKVKCLRWLSPKFCCTWLLYRLCFREYISEKSDTFSQNNQQSQQNQQNQQNLQSSQNIDQLINDFGSINTNTLTNINGANNSTGYQYYNGQINPGSIHTSSNHLLSASNASNPVPSSYSNRQQPAMSIFSTLQQQNFEQQNLQQSQGQIVGSHVSNNLFLPSSQQKK